MDDVTEIVEEILDDELKLGAGQKLARWTLSSLAGVAAVQLTENAFDAAVRTIRARRS